MNVLMVAFEGGRWGATRLVKPLRQAGFGVAALCPADNPLMHTRFLRQHFPLSSVNSSARVEKALARAMAQWKPGLIVPCDERAVTCLHALVRSAGPHGTRHLDSRAIKTIAASLGRPEHFDASVMKSDTMHLARQLGVRVPAGATVTTIEQATAAADNIGYPVFVKKSFSWAGQGVTLCNDATGVAAALDTAQARRRLPFHALLKKLAHRDWYPTVSSVDVQQAIAGTPAFYCAVAVGGKMVAGFAGLVQQTTSATGPSSVVRFAAHAEMASASARMIEALGSTGFIGFDFMIETETGNACLLECNPRPIPSCHLGTRVGVDLCGALAAALRGDTQPCAPACREEEIALFPQEWQRDPAALAAFGGFVDAPQDDPMLVRFMVAQAKLPVESLPPHVAHAVDRRWRVRAEADQAQLLAA
jgi:hypothetical protein